MDGEIPTRYVKPSRRATPVKADHAHEYVRVVTWNRIRRFDGSVSVEKYKFDLPVACLVCGHVKRRARNSEAVEVEVSLQEFQQIKSERA